MAECKKCKKSGWFLPVYGPGLCAECVKAYKVEVPQRIRIVNDCLRILKDSKNLETKLSRFDLLIQHATALSLYDQFQIHTIDFQISHAKDGQTETKTLTPTQFVAEREKQRDLIIFNTLRAIVNEATEKSEIAATLTAKVSSLSKALLQIHKYKKQSSNPESFNPLESKMLDLIQRAKLDNMLEAGNKAVFKGQKNKARNHYADALFFLKNVANESLKNQFLTEIENKIAGLTTQTEE